MHHPHWATHPTIVTSRTFNWRKGFSWTLRIRKNKELLCLVHFHRYLTRQSSNKNNRWWQYRPPPSPLLQQHTDMKIHSRTSLKRYMLSHSCHLQIFWVQPEHLWHPYQAHHQSVGLLAVHQSSLLPFTRGCWDPDDGTILLPRVLWSGN